MAKKRQETTDSDAAQRQSRKEILVARKHESDVRTLRIAMGIVLGLIAIVALVAIINEVAISPNRSVITMGDKTVSMRDWQNRVRFERAQRIIYLDNQLETFGGDVGIVQQFAGQVINDLVDPSVLGQVALDAMADETAICQAVADRGITITDADIDAEIGANYGYFGGALPTASPQPTQTVPPTPSLTPIPVVAPDGATPTAVPPTPTVGPTETPLPTPTAVSAEAFQEEFGGVLAQFEEQGVDEATYRSVVRAELCRDKLAEALATEQSLATTGPHTSLFLMSFATEEEALAAAQAANTSDAYLTEWNTIRSRPAPTSDTEEAPTSGAFELLWRSDESLQSAMGPEASAAVAALGINEPSGVITIAGGDGSSTYYVAMVTGREDQPLSESELATKRQELVQDFVDEAKVGNLVIDESWRNRVPTSPILDPKFLAQPTAIPTPTAGAVEITPLAPTATPEAGE